MKPAGHHESFAGHSTPALGSDRSFCFVFAAVFATVGLWGETRPWALALAAAFLLTGLLAPQWAHPLHVRWMQMALLLSRITNPLVMALLYFLVFTPFALVFRLSGRDALRLRRDPAAASYWLPRQPGGPDPGTMTNQF